MSNETTRKNCTVVFCDNAEPCAAHTGTRRIYCTTFCNFGHYVDTGRPIGHECYILDPVKLRREADGDETVFREDIKQYPVQIVKGRKLKGDR